jgi:hypothetical protein
MPGVGVGRDEIAASPVRGRIHISRHVEIEHALTVEIHEREPLATLAFVVV